MLKRTLKTLLGSRYELVSKLKNSDSSRLIRCIPLMPVQHYWQRRNKPYFPFKIVGGVGLGGSLTMLVRLLKYAEENSLTPVCEIVNPLYSSFANEDILSTYFSAKQVALPEGTPKLHYHKIVHFGNFAAFRVPSTMTIKDASRVFSSHFSINPAIMRIADEFMSQHFVTAFDLSIHYRSTDKRIEARPVAIFDMLEIVEKALENTHERTAIFLATDDPRFAAEIRNHFPERNFLSFEYEPQKLGVPRHFSTLDPAKKAAEAIVNMILISRARTCIRTVSLLSAWSKILNPELPVFTVNQSYERLAFPERELWEERFRSDGLITMKRI